MPLSILLYCGIGTVLGIFAHLAVFIHGEWHVRAPEVLIFHTALFALASVAKILSSATVHHPFFEGILYTSFCYVLALLASITVYRLWFHRLTRGRFPGPWYLRVSKLCHVWKVRKSTNHLVLEDLRQRYGDFVRTGPAEVTVFHPEVFSAVDGPRSECIKSEWYDLLYPFLSLVSARDKSIHAARRREWLRCFTSKALIQHEDKILEQIDELDRCIENNALAHKPSEMRDLCFWFGFDAMGRFVFNRSFRMLSDQKWHYVVVRLQRALSLLGPLSPTPWLVQLGLRLGPKVWVIRDWHESATWTKGEMRARLEDGCAKRGGGPDLTHYLMEQKGEISYKDGLYWMHGDSLLAIVAGSEPTAYVLLAIFCELAKHPEDAEKMYEELKGADATNLRVLNRLPHLNAVINETLRLYPVLLTGGARKTTKEGVMIGGTYIPPNTTIVSPRFSIQRREDCFEQAGSFIPERWTTHPEMIRNIAAFNPFSTGHHSCLGRQLAMDIMKLVVAKLVKKYRIQLAPGESGSRVFDGMVDQFTANPGNLSLCFVLR